MKARIVLGAAAILLAYVALRPGITPIGGGWAIGRARIGSSQSLIRIGAHPLLQRTTVARGVTTYRFFKPDCVVYLARSSYDGKMWLAACGERTPIAVQEGYFGVGPYGLRYVLKEDTFDGIPKTIERHVPIGRILAAAKRAGPYASMLIPRSERPPLIPITYARFPVGIEQRNYGDHTALHEFVSRGSEDSVSALLGLGVFPDLLDEKGITPLMLTVIMQADTGLAPVLADTLLRAGADVDAQTSSGMTALMYARRAGATNVYKLLLAWRADTTLRNAGGQRAMDMLPVPGYDPLSR